MYINKISPNPVHWYRANCNVMLLPYYFGGVRSKGFAKLRNVSKLTFFGEIGQAKSVGFRFYSGI